MCVPVCNILYVGRMGNIQEALKLITERLQDVNKVNLKEKNLKSLAFMQ